MCENSLHLMPQTHFHHHREVFSIYHHHLHGTGWMACVVCLCN